MGKGTGTLSKGYRRDQEPDKRKHDGERGERDARIRRSGDQDAKSDEDGFA